MGEAVGAMTRAVSTTSSVAAILVKLVTTVQACGRPAIDKEIGRVQHQHGSSLGTTRKG